MHSAGCAILQLAGPEPWFVTIGAQHLTDVPHTLIPGAVRWADGRPSLGGWTLHGAHPQALLACWCRHTSTSCLAAANTRSSDGSSAAGRENSTSASCRAAGLLRRHGALTPCRRPTLRSCGHGERSTLDHRRPGPSPPHPSVGLKCPGPHGGARSDRVTDVT